MYTLQKFKKNIPTSDENYLKHYPRLLTELIIEDYKMIMGSGSIAVFDLNDASIIVDYLHLLHPLTIIGRTKRKIGKARCYLDKKIKKEYPNLKLKEYLIKR